MVKETVLELTDDEIDALIEAEEDTDAETDELMLSD